MFFELHIGIWYIIYLYITTKNIYVYVYNMHISRYICKSKCIYLFYIMVYELHYINPELLRDKFSKFLLNYLFLMSIGHVFFCILWTENPVLAKHWVCGQRCSIAHELTLHLHTYNIQIRFKYIILKGVAERKCFFLKRCKFNLKS